jgi:hypothetical protein
LGEEEIRCDVVSGSGRSRGMQGMVQYSTVCEAEHQSAGRSLAGPATVADFQRDPRVNLRWTLLLNARRVGASSGRVEREEEGGGGGGEAGIE